MEFWKSLIVIMMAILKSTDAAASWTYTEGAYGPSNWYKVSSKCDGSLQSPIDYKTSDITYGKSLGEITLEGYGAPQYDSNVTLQNNGHSLVVDINHPFAANISGTGLPGKFTLLNVHFHWGNSDAEGSEHNMYGKAFPAEIHFVHYNMKYVGNIEAAVAAKDGLAVLGIFLEAASSDNAALNPILDYAANVTTKGVNTTIPNFNLREILPTDISQFFRNNGSLTTPNCEESVTWTVFKNLGTISQGQLNSLRSLKKENGQPLQKTYRPIQLTNGRKILATFAAPPINTTPKPTNASTSTKPTSGTQTPQAALLTSILCGLLSLSLKF